MGGWGHPSEAPPANRRAPLASRWADAIGITPEFADAIRLGCVDAHAATAVLTAKIRSRSGSRTEIVFSPGNPVRGPSALAHWSTAPAHTSHVLILPDIAALWLMQQALGESIEPFVMVAPMDPMQPPPEWADAGYWRFKAVTILRDSPFETSATVALLGKLSGSGSRTMNPPAGSSWRDHLRENGCSYEDLVQLISYATEHSNGFVADGTAPAASVRSRLSMRSIHDLDDDGRLRRCVRLLERQTGQDGRARERVRDVVIRSDGACLELVRVPAPPGTPKSALTVATSDGTRLSERLSGLTPCAWSLEGLAAFVTGNARFDTGNRSRATWVILLHLLVDAGLDVSSAQVIGAFVLMTHLHCAFLELPVLVVHGGSDEARLVVRSLLAGLCHGAVQVARTRAANMARLADATGGTLLLNEPGPLMSANGSTEVGRFLSSSATPDTSEHNVFDPHHGCRALRIFGPRAVIAKTAPSDGLGCALEIVGLDALGALKRKPALDAAISELRDCLYAWSMSTIGEVTRRVQGLAGTDVLAMILELVGADLDRQQSPDIPAARETAVVETSPVARATAAPARVNPADTLAAAFATTTRGRDTLSMIELMLELAVLEADPEECNPERVGRWLAAHEKVDHSVPVTRRRLHGQISRLYSLLPERAALGTGPESKTVFSFCQGKACGGCRYEAVCDRICPGMRDRKIISYGRSGPHTVPTSKS